MPAWTVGKNKAELEALALLAGFTGCAILGKIHALNTSLPLLNQRNRIITILLMCALPLPLIA